MRDKDAYARLAALREMEYDAIRKEAYYRKRKLLAEHPAFKRPDHYCASGDADLIKTDCTRCMDKLYTATTGREAPTSYEGWRDEYARSERENTYAFERMMGLVDLSTEDVLTPKPKLEAPSVRASRNRMIRASMLPVLLLNVVMLGVNMASGSVMALVSLFGIVACLFTIAMQTKVIKRVEHRPA